MTYIVTVDQAAAYRFYLRGTTWAFSMDRAQQFPTREAAQAGLQKAKPFMKAAIYRKAQIETIG